VAIKGGAVSVMGPYHEQLASLPAVPRGHLTSGDGSEPQGADGSSRIAPPSAVTLQTADTPTKFKAVDALVRSQDRMTKNDYAIDTHFRRVRDGIPFSRLDKIPNQSIWVAKLPNGLNRESAAAQPNKADDLCNKVEDTLMADPPLPDPTPHVQGQTAQAAAKLAAAFLHMDGGENGTNDNETFRWALNNAFTGASSYLHYRVDPSGGGYQPLQKLAHPQAQDPSNPLVAMVPLQGPPGPDGQPQMIQERTSDPVLRYVNGTQFVEQASQAEKVWLPKIVIDRMRREQVRCFPASASVDTAKAVILLRPMTLSEAITEWPKTVGRMDKDDLAALASWKPSQSELIVPFALRSSGEGQSGPGLEEVGSFAPLLQRRMWSYRLYIACCPEYPEGYQLDISGAQGGTVLDETVLEYTVELPDAGQEARCMDIPVVQIRPQQDVAGGNPKGWPFIARFAGASELASVLYGAFADFCDNMLHPHVFLRSTVAVDDDDWFDRTRPIILHPQDQPPFYEQFPNMPPVIQFLENLNQRDDVMSGLTATAQGLDSSNSVSGIAKNAVVRQAQISMSGFQQNLLAGFSRGWRIKCQLVQASFTIPQLMDYTGQEGSDEPTWWTGENFAGVDRVGIQPGTGTMMTPETKAQYVAFLQGQQWLPPDQAADVALPGIRSDLGLPQDPFVAAVERSVSNWLQGPPEGWIEANALYQQQLQAYQVQQQQMQQQAQAQQPPPVDPQAVALSQQHQAEQQHAAAMAQTQMQVKDHETQSALQVEQAKHQMAMEKAATDLQHAQAVKQAQPAPVVVQPPDLSGIADVLSSIEQRLTESANQPAPVVPPAQVHVDAPDLSGIAKALQTMQATVHALAQKDTNPVVIQHEAPAQPAPVVHVHPASEPVKKRGKRTGKITTPEGKSFTVELGGDE